MKKVIFLFIGLLSLQLFAEEESQLQENATLGKAIETVDRYSSKLWEKVKIDFDTKIVNENFSIDSDDHPLSVGVNFKYKYTVTPAYIKDLHHRFDRYILNLSAGTSVAEHLGVGAGINITTTFARLFEDKWVAIKSTPYFPNRIPWTADRALHHLQPGDIARLEMSLNGNIGTGSESSSGSAVKARASLGLHSGSSVILDVYRMKEHRIRVRIVTTRSTANINLSAGVGLTKAIDFGANLFHRISKGNIHFNPLSLGTSFNPLDALPVDTMMVDYVFNLASDDARKAYDEIFAKLYYLKFAKFLNFMKKEKEHGKKMFSEVAVADDLFLRYKELPLDFRPIDRIFKGRTVTNFWTTNVDTKVKAFANILTNGYTVYNSQSFIRGFDEDNKPLDLIYLVSNKTSNFSALADFFKKTKYDSFQSLFHAAPKDNSEKMEVRPTQPSDLIFMKNIGDANLSLDQITSIKSYLERSAPAAIKDIDWSKIESLPKLINGYVQTQILFHEETLQAISGNLSAGEIYTKLRKLVDEHPEKNWLPVTMNTQGQNPEMAQTQDKFEEDIQTMTYKFNTLLNDPSPEKKLEALAELKMIQLFQEIGPAFLFSLLPKEKIKDLVYVKVNAGSSKGALINHNFGKEDLSALYSSLQFMLALINDRGFDLRVQLEGNGYQIFKMKNDPTNICENCDIPSTNIEKLPKTSTAGPSQNN